MRLSEYAYNLLIHAGLPAFVVGTYAAFRGRDPDYQTGKKYAKPSEPFFEDECRLWVHGASVGEAGVINTVLRLARELGVERNRIVVSTQTRSGREAVDHDRTFLLPADYPALVGPLSASIDADCLAVVETELWPNLYRHNSGRVLQLNARMSDETVGSYRWLKPLLHDTLGHARGIHARSSEDYRRFLEFGVGSDRLHDTGDLKWTRALDPPEASVEIPWDPDEATVITAGSTHPGEEQMILEALEGRDVRIVLAPRHLDRISEVESLLEERGEHWGRWSDQPFADGEAPEVLLVDEFGLLEGLYRHSDLALVGGSWRTEGGHNLLEAAQYGVPVVTGPRLENFRAMADFLRDQNLLEVVTEDDLAERLEELDLEGESRRRFEELREEIEPIEDRYRRVLAEALGEEVTTDE